MSRSYGQYCGVARALELVGERWGLLVVRDLILGPKRFTELREGLPRIPASLLSARLNELEEAGVVHRRVLPQLDASVVYELTEYGSELETIVLMLGQWGARSLGQPADGDIFTFDSAVLSLYTIFQPERARGLRLTFTLHAGPIVLHAVVDDGVLKVADGDIPDPDLRIEAFGSLTPLFAGEVTAREAVASGLLRATGDPQLLELMPDLFHILPGPHAVAGLAVH